MASKRISKSALDWKKFQSLVPQNQQPQFSQLMGKNFQYVSRYINYNINSTSIKFSCF